MLDFDIAQIHFECILWRDAQGKSAAHNVLLLIQFIILEEQQNTLINRLILSNILIYSSWTIIMATAEQPTVETFKEFIKNYNRLSELCFDSCIWNFTSRDVSSKENQCINNCFEKFIKTHQRISQRFQEHQLAAVAKQ